MRKVHIKYTASTKLSVFFSVNFVIHGRKRKFNVSWKVFEKRGSPRAVGFSRFHAGFFVIEAVNLLSRTFRVLIRCGACVVQRLVTETRALLSVNARKIISNLFSTKSFDRAKAPETIQKIYLFSSHEFQNLILRFSSSTLAITWPAPETDDSGPVSCHWATRNMVQSLPL